MSGEIENKASNVTFESRPKRKFIYA